MEYSWNADELSADGPRLLPAPLVAGALYLPSDVESEGEIRKWVTVHSYLDPADASIWVVTIWDQRHNECPVAQSAYAWSNGRVERYALAIEEDYSNIGLETFMDRLSEGLFVRYFKDEF